MKKQRSIDDYPARRPARFVQHSRLPVTTCEGCSRQLHKTHNFVFYGNWCRPCWLAVQATDASYVAHAGEPGEMFS